MWTLKALLITVNETSVEINGRWVPSRPVSYRTPWQRVREAWLVFTGVADCFVWPENQ